MTVACTGVSRLYFPFFTSYARIYGSLGAVMVLLTWFYVIEIMLLLGAEANMVIEVAPVRAHAVLPEKSAFRHHPWRKCTRQSLRYKAGNWSSGSETRRTLEAYAPAGPHS